MFLKKNSPFWFLFFCLFLSLCLSVCFPVFWIHMLIVKSSNWFICVQIVENMPSLDTYKVLGLLTDLPERDLRTPSEGWYKWSLTYWYKQKNNTDIWWHFIWWENFNSCKNEFENLFSASEGKASRISDRELQTSG